LRLRREVTALVSNAGMVKSSESKCELGMSYLRGERD
jgi:hypothetical protein